MWRGLKEQGPCGRGGFRRIERLRRRAARIDHSITELLARTLITPLNAEDLRAVSVQLNRIIESLMEAAWQQSTVKAGSAPDLLINMYERAFRSSKHLIQAVSSMPDAAPVGAFAFELREAQRQVKRVQRGMIADLIERTSDPVEIMNWKRVYEWPLII